LDDFAIKRWDWKQPATKEEEELYEYFRAFDNKFWFAGNSNQGCPFIHEGGKRTPTKKYRAVDNDDNSSKTDYWGEFLGQEEKKS